MLFDHGSLKPSSMLSPFTERRYEKIGSNADLKKKLKK
jgi:hypothetical protein